MQSNLGGYSFVKTFTEINSRYDTALERNINQLHIFYTFNNQTISMNRRG